MIQDQALVASKSKHYLVETENKNLVDNAKDSAEDSAEDGDDYNYQGWNLPNTTPPYWNTVLRGV